MSQTELKQILIHIIRHIGHQQLRDVFIDAIKNNILLKSEQ